MFKCCGSVRPYPPPRPGPKPNQTKPSTQLISTQLNLTKPNIIKSNKFYFQPNQTKSAEEGGGRKQDTREESQSVR